MGQFTKLLWLELIGLDNTKNDFGTAEFLARMKVKPEIISLLLWNTELIHSHTDLTCDAPIGAKHCAYYARPRNEERERQDWTKFQLKKLISLFQQSGIKVYVSFFDQVMSAEYQKKMNIPLVHEWLSDHPEILAITKDSETGEIAPLKHLADQSLYEDFFFSQLERFMQDYGFDGLHAADGYAHPRLPLCFGDFSEDMIGQFRAWKNLEIRGTTTQEKAQWILLHLRKEWSLFHCDRQAQFWKKGMDMLARNNWGHCFNTCWTRDPLEAIWRYGVDYRKLVDAGVRNFVQEAQAAVLETEGWNHSGIPMQDQFRAISTQLKAFVPEAEIFLLHCLKDGMEQYNVLRHAPAFMDSDIFSLANTIYGNKRVLSGAMTCLSDGIRPSEWERIDRAYERAFQAEPATVPIPQIVWSDRAFRKMLEYYAEKRIISPFRIHTHLLSQGAVLFGSINLKEHAAESQGPLVVLHPAFYDKTELDVIRKISGGNYALIGLFEDDSFRFELYVDNQKMEYISAGLQSPESWQEPPGWLMELPEYKPDTTFFSNTAEKLNQYFALFHPLKDNALIRTWGFMDKKQQLRLFIGSEKRNYMYAEIFLKEEFSSVELLSDELVLPPVIRKEKEGMVIRTKLPPSGTIPLLLKK